MRFAWSASAGIVIAVATAGSAACGGSDQNPLGGPYGGNTTIPPPDPGTTNADPSVGPGDDASASVTGSSSSGSSSGSPGGGSGSSSGPSSSSGSGSGSGHPSSSSGSSSGIPTGSSSGTAHPSSSGSSGGPANGSSSSSSGGGVAPTGTPTFTYIFNTYLANGTIGKCTGCHGQMSSPSASYSWLQSRGQVGSANPGLASASVSCLSWYGGNMPPFGPQSAQAVADMNAWAAAGGKNN
jgi:hypothetical protein